MSKRTTDTKTLFARLAEQTREELSDAARVRVAKNAYLINNGEEIKEAKAAGYSYAMIAKAATAELLNTDLPEIFTAKNKDGEEVTVETKFRPGEIKKFCEP